MKHIGMIISVAFAAILTTAFIGCGRAANTFSATDFKQSLSWVDGLASHLDRVAGQRNSIALKEAYNSATQQVMNTVIVGTKVSWKLHVLSVDQDGVNFKESIYAIMRTPDNCIKVDFDPKPRFSPEQLRTMNSGDTVMVRGTISEVSVSSSMTVWITLTDVMVN